MKQLVFELAPAEPPSFDSFLPGRNAEAVAMLKALSRQPRETSVLLWGAPAAGKTHLLQALVRSQREHSLGVADLRADDLPVELEPDPSGVVALDRVDNASGDEAGRIFTLFNRLREHGGTLVAASRLPLARLPVREDLRTRIGSGLVYEILPLADEEKPLALAAYAHQRGFSLGSDVIDYLLRHGRRDMGSLVSTLEALDRYSLASKRPVTLQFLRECLQKEIEWPTSRIHGD